MLCRLFNLQRKPLAESIQRIQVARSKVWVDSEVIFIIVLVWRLAVLTFLTAILSSKAALWVIHNL